MAEIPHTHKIGNVVFLAYKDNEIHNEHDHYCARCVDPGHCCKALLLNIDFPSGSTAADVQAHMDQMELPYVPLARIDVLPNGDRWNFNCSALGENGRCTVYDRRPLACKLYDPGVDKLCVHHRVNGKPVVPLLPVLRSKSPARKTRKRKYINPSY